MKRKIHIGMATGVNFFVKGTIHYINATAGTVEILDGGRAIFTTPGAATTFTMENADHGLNVGDPVRAVGVRNMSTPSVAPLIDPSVVYVVTAVTGADVEINLTTTEVGNRGYLGRVMEDYFKLDNVDVVGLSAKTVFAEGEDRVG